MSLLTNAERIYKAQRAALRSVRPKGCGASTSGPKPQRREGTRWPWSVWQPCETSALDEGSGRVMATAERLAPGACTEP